MFSDDDLRDHFERQYAQGGPTADTARAVLDLIERLRASLQATAEAAATHCKTVLALRAELSSLRNDDEVIGRLVGALGAFNAADIDEEQVAAAFFAGLNDKLDRAKEIAARCAARQAPAAVKDRP